MKIGDYVRLKSGGPSMQIADINSGTGRIYALCVWQGISAAEEDWLDVRMLDPVRHTPPGIPGEKQ